MIRERRLIPATLVLCVAVILASSSTIPDNAQRKHIPKELSLEAEQIILDLKNQLNFTSITDSLQPIYRKDLPDDYIAYWLVIFDDSDYVIVSSGPQTGDIKFRFQGSLPTVTSSLETNAAENNAKCDRFYLLTPDGVEMMCEDKYGAVVASTINDDLLRNQTLADPYVSLAQQFVESRLCDMRVEWAKHGMEVTHKGEWMDEELLAEGQEEEEQGQGENRDEIEEDEDNKGLFGTATDQNFNERAITPGETQRLALGDSTMLKYVFIRYRQEQTNPDEELEALNATYGQSQLCKVVTVCSPTNQHVVNKGVIKIIEGTGLAYVDIHVKKEAQTIIERRDIHFVIEIHRTNKAIVKYHYGLSYSANRQRRKQTQPWSSWTTRSIKDEGYFPHYNQHTPTGSRCPVGCGPVAWAMIFGYFDRRSHYKTSTHGSGSQSLFRCGADGTTGSNSCTAPQTTTTAIKGYTEKLNSEMRTFCLFGGGATFMGRMDDVGIFYKARQGSGSPNIVQKKTFWSTFGFKQSSIASWTRDRINEGWPVVVGASEGFLKWHYPVVTQYRSRSRRYRSCFIWCGRWKTETEYQMYTHQGWGGYKDGWRAMKVFFAIAARY